MGQNNKSLLALDVPKLIPSKALIYNFYLKNFHVTLKGLNKKMYLKVSTKKWKVYPSKKQGDPQTLS